MKKITLVLTPSLDYGDVFTATLPNGNTARLCKGGMNRIFGMNRDHSYRLTLRQTLTENKTTNIRLEHTRLEPEASVWYWYDVQNPENSRVGTNVFLGNEIDSFLDQTFGTENNLFFRITVTPIV